MALLFGLCNWPDFAVLQVLHKAGCQNLQSNTSLMQIVNFLFREKRDKGCGEAECYMLQRIMCFGIECFICAFHIGSVET